MPMVQGVRVEVCDLNSKFLVPLKHLNRKSLGFLGLHKKELMKIMC